MRYLALIISLSWTITTIHSANILGIFPLPGKSHFTMFERLFRKLAEIGHNVDVATHFPIKDAPPRYNQLSLVGSLPILVNNLSIDVFDGFSHYDMVHFMTKICGLDVCEATLKTPVLQNLKSTKTKYDLVITEIFGADCMLGFGHYFKAPTISIISSTILPWGGDRFGNPDNPSYIPNYFAMSTDKMNLYERLENTITLIWSKFLYYYFTSKDANRIAREFFGTDLPSLEELAYNTSLLFVNSHFSMNNAKPFVPNVIEVGGLHIHEPKPLSKYFENLLTSDINKGIIYLTMGSMIVTETFEANKLQGLFDAFGELPYKILWKANRDNFLKNLTIPKNIYFENWMPQIDILCHPNIKLFVSHGGLMGSQESIYCGVPRIGIPLFADQDANIRLSEKLGLLVKVAYEDISRETILNAAQKVLGDPSYKRNSKLLSRRFKDRPLSAIDTATYWVEYVIRHQGAPHLRTVGANLPWYKYYLIDVGTILIGVLFTVSLGFMVLLKLIMNMISSQKEKFD